MIETRINERYTQAYKAAHLERAAAFQNVLRWVLRRR